LDGAWLYVGGIDYSIVDKELHDLFSIHSKINSAIVVIDRMTGRSKGFGFVEAANKNEALFLIEKLNNTEFKKRRITVSMARPQVRRC
jgi:RNA recognition motif-containing protein